MYVYECKNCYLSKRLLNHIDVKRCICCEGEVEVYEESNKSCCVDFSEYEGEIEEAREAFV